MTTAPTAALFRADPRAAHSSAHDSTARPTKCGKAARAGVCRLLAKRMRQAGRWRAELKCGNLRVGSMYRAANRALQVEDAGDATPTHDRRLSAARYGGWYFEGFSRAEGNKMAASLSWSRGPAQRVTWRDRLADIRRSLQDRRALIDDGLRDALRHAARCPSALQAA